MNALKRRQLAEANVVDAEIARVAINRSRRMRAEAAARLRKEMAAKNFATRPADTVAYPS
jgi:hypothetical protein